MRFKKELLTEGSIVVHCNTEEKAKKLLEWADSEGRRWANDSYLDTNKWSFYEEDTCYRIAENSFSSKKFFSNTNNNKEYYNIITYEDAIDDYTRKLYTMVKERLNDSTTERKN
ncbi:MAG: hypothetical protein PF569_03790 [Candidatus Woesearchaeota archaeon]|jgi:enolase|nr:hypothetical protein [Candidatus Woesearchaeota archaeon]